MKAKVSNSLDKLELLGNELKFHILGSMKNRLFELQN